MGLITRGFGARRHQEDPRVPPGQTTVSDWPVLSAGSTPMVALDTWSFSIQTEDGTAHQWSWNEIQGLGVEDIRTDIHCVTHWTKLDMPWRGVPLDALFADVTTSRAYCMVHSHGGYTTNVPLADLLNGQAWIAFEADGAPLTPEHGGPARLLVPHLYFWKSAKWVRGITMQAEDHPGFWENAGYHIHGDPWKEERYW